MDKELNNLFLNSSKFLKIVVSSLDVRYYLALEQEIEAPELSHYRYL